jgi:Uncharacterised nucleotidyltransferase
MADQTPKRLVLRALQRDPDFAAIATLPSPGSRNGQRLMLWLDESGLALNLLVGIRTQAASSRSIEEWREVLELRMERNAIRMKDMLAEFQRLNNAFRTKGIRVITLKGFSLVPDFCPDPVVRHQTDFDYLVDPHEVAAAGEVLQSFGYSTPKLSCTEESSFITPLFHTPARGDNLYALQHHRQVDLHVSVIESSPWLDIAVPRNSVQHAVPRNLKGVQFYSLPLADQFVCQALHAFRHCFRSWLRLSWLLELGRCMELHQADDALWEIVIARSGDGPTMRRIFAFVLSLTNRLFQARIPSPFLSRISPSMTPVMLAWLDQFSVEWAISDWPGNLSNLFLASEFISDKKLRKQYFASRLLPKRARMSIETMASPQKKHSMAWNFQRWQYLAHRSRVHLKSLVSLPLEQLRWKRALSAAQHRLSESES